MAISSWDPQQAGPDTEITDGRSFVLQIGGRMDVDHARFEYLGFGTGTSSGVAWRGAAADVAGSTERIKAQGTVTYSVFAHNHFGAYTHEAQGMLWEDNTFADNTEYGFDPHDFSDDFLVTATPPTTTASTASSSPAAATATSCAATTPTTTPATAS